MNLLKKIKEEFFPPKSDRQRFEEEAWRQLRWKKSEEGKRHAAFEKEAREIESNYMDDINPWSSPF